MKRQLYGVLLLAIIFFIPACSLSKQKPGFSNRKSNSSSEKEFRNFSSENDVHVTPFLQLYNGNIYQNSNEIDRKLSVEKSMKNHIVWAVPTFGSSLLSKSDLKNFNKYLSEKYSLYLDVLYINCDENGRYNDILKGFIKKNLIDIFQSGLVSVSNLSHDCNSYKMLIKDKYASDLTDSVKRNKKLYRCFSEPEWNGELYKGKIYDIPCQSYFSQRCYGLFKKTDFRKKEIKDLTDDVADSIAFLNKKNKDGRLRKSVCWSLSYFEMLNNAGVFENDGLWISHRDGTVMTAYDDEKFRDMLSELNRLFNNSALTGKLNLIESLAKNDERIKREKCSAAFLTDGYIADKLKKDYYVKRYKYYYKAYGYSGTMLSEKSEKKVMSLSLITSLLSDSHLANLLILGTRGKDYFVNQEGYAADKDGDPCPQNLKKSVFGIYDDVINAVTGDFGRDPRIGKEKYFKSKKCRISKINGFRPDYTKIKRHGKNFLKSLKVVKSENFDRDYSDLINRFRKSEKYDRAEVQKEVNLFLNSDRGTEAVK